MSRFRIVAWAALSFAVVGAVLAVWSLTTNSDRDPAAAGGPLDESPPAWVNNQLDADAGRVNDFDPVVALSNPFDKGLRIESVISIPDPDSPAPIEVETFHLVGPSRKVDSISGGIQSERDYGVPLIPASDAVIPAHAQPGDYILLLRVAIGPDVSWARNAGFEVHYRVGDEQFVSRWSRLITYCSLEERGTRFCERVARGGIDIHAE